MIRVAIVGAGAIAWTHAEAFLRCPDRCKVVAVCNRRPERAQKLINELGLDAKAYAALPDALAAQPLDAVSICLPPAQHADMTVWALEHGLDVLVEKPMANSLEECDRMIAAARSSGKLLSVVCQLRFTTPVHRLRCLIAEERFGPVQYAAVNSLWWRGDHYHDVSWRGRWTSEGGGVLTAQAIHHVDLLQYLLGMPKRVTAVIANVGHSNTECEDVAAATLEYPDKFVQIDASLVAQGEKQELNFYAKRGCLSLPWRPAACSAMPNGFPEVDEETCRAIQAAYDAIAPLTEEEHAGQVGNFLRAIQGQESLLADGTEGRKPVELITAIYKSAALHVPTELPLRPDDPFYTTEGKAANMPHFHEKYRSVESSAEGRIQLAGGVK